MYFCYTPLVQAFNFICFSCGSQLLETGLLLSSNGQCPFVCCETCRTLYYIDVVENYQGLPVIIVEPTHLDQDVEFDIIRNAQKRTPLKEHLSKAEGEAEKIVNPHFDKDLKSAIEESVTPSDLIRKIKANG